MDETWLAERFEAERPRLMAVAYRGGKVVQIGLTADAERLSGLKI